MRIRTAKFVMVPMWVMTHPKVRGNSTRIAVYAGLRAVAWEAPDMEWRSIREMARSIQDVIGVGEEAVRKHLAELGKIGAMLRHGDEIIIPDDDPELGIAVGTTKPNVGYDDTQTEGPTLFTLEEREEKTPVGTTGAWKPNQEHPSFARFWDAYPKKKDRFKAITAYNNAILHAPPGVILEGLEREKDGWKRARRPFSKIPYPATWLNRAGWMNEPDRAEGAANSTAARARAAADRQLDEVQEAMSEGRWDDAWSALVQKAGSHGHEWWVLAERIRDRPDEVVALTVGVTVDEIAQWRELRRLVYDGQWSKLSMSPAVRELGS